MSEFKLLDRGSSDTILLIPGWATDFRIFAPLDIRFNYLFPDDFSPFGFGADLARAMSESGMKKVSVLGWSMGAFVACDLLPKYAELVDEVILVGARIHYPKAENEKIKDLLIKNSKAFLYKFYRDCFSAEDKGAFTWFKENLLEDYLERTDLKNLFEGLDYLSARRMETSRLEDVNVTFVHGKLDKIAPLKEAEELKRALPSARAFYIEGAGHMPFLSQKFKRIFDGYK